MSMKYLYCADKDKAKELINSGYKLVFVNPQYHIFELIPEQYSVNHQSKELFILDKLKLSF